MSWRGRSQHQPSGNVPPALLMELRCENIRSEWSSGETSNDRHWLEWLHAWGWNLYKIMNWDGSCLYPTAWDWMRLLAFQGRSLLVGLLFPGHVNSFRLDNVGNRVHDWLFRRVGLPVDSRSQTLEIARCEYGLQQIYKDLCVRTSNSLKREFRWHYYRLMFLKMLQMGLPGMTATAQRLSVPNHVQFNLEAQAPRQLWTNI